MANYANKSNPSVFWFLSMHDVLVHEVENRVLIKCRKSAKKLATWRFEPSTFRGNRVNRENDSLKLPAALSYQAAYFYIIAVYFRA